jgi:hypothetical protein
MDREFHSHDESEETIPDVQRSEHLLRLDAPPCIGH